MKMWKNIRYLFALALMDTILIPNLYSQWEKTNGPGIDRIFSIAAIGSYIFAGTSGGGVFSSSDQGVRWNRNVNGLSDHSVYSIFANYDQRSGIHVYAATNTGSVFYSNDTSRTWINISGNLVMDKSATSVVALDSNLFVGMHGNGIFHSTNNGKEWSQIMFGNYVYDMKAMRDRDDVLIIYAALDVGIYKTTDMGKKWTGLNLGSTNYSIDVIDTNLFVCADYGLYHSTNDGGTWHLESNGIPTNVRFRTIDAVKNDAGSISLFVGSHGSGVFVSHDSGGHWQQSNTGLDMLYINSIKARLSENNTFSVCAGSEAGVYTSQDGGYNWKLSGPGLTSTTPYALLVGGNKLFAATERNVFFSTDHGNIWHEGKFHVKSTSDIPFVLSLSKSVSLTNDTIYFAGTKDLGIYQSTDEGKNWEHIISGATPAKALTTFPLNDTTDTHVILIGTETGLFRATSKEDKYALCNPSFATNSLITVPHMVNGFGLFAATNANGVYYSSDYGENWTIKNNGISGYNIVCLTFISDTSGSSTIFAGTARSIYYSKNHGTLWTRINNTPFRFNVLSMKALQINDSKIILLVGTANGLVVFEQNDTNWINTFDGVNESTVHSIERMDSSIFVGLYKDGVWKSSLKSTVTTIQGKMNSSANFFLHQNYPNPFNPMTKILFQIPRDGFVELIVFDMLGRKISNLINERLREGNHEILFDASRLSAGIYFYRLRHNSSVQTNKMVLLK